MDKRDFETSKIIEDIERNIKDNKGNRVIRSVYKTKSGCCLIMENNAYLYERDEII